MIAAKPAKLAPSKLLPVHSVGSHFVSYFPYLFDWIYSKRERIDWKTETRYPLSASLLWDKHQDKNQIVGVRFGNQTSYAMLDIDRKSPYHPSNSQAKFKIVVDALADIGLYEYLVVRSSASQGLHLYYPLEYQVNSFDLACAIRQAIEASGLEIANGILEAFPNTKAYNSKYNAHRLPLQDGSWLLAHNFEPYSNSVEVFCNLWDRAAPCQDLELLCDRLAVARQNHKAVYKTTGKLNDWQEELEKILDQGWTATGQTNDLLHKVCQYARVFLGFTDLNMMIEWATHKVSKLNGFNKYCNHKSDLIRRIRDWAKYCFAHNFPMASKEEKDKMTAKFREQQRELTIQRIRDAANSISDRYGNTLTIRETAKKICKEAKCSNQTLYKHLSLWHPEYKDIAVTANYLDTQADLEAVNQQSLDNEKQSVSTVTQISYEVLGDGANNPKSSNFGATGFQPLSSMASLMKSTKIKLLEGQIAARKLGNTNPESLLEIERLKEEIRKLKE